MHRYAGAEVNAALDDGMVIDVAVAHHLQHAAFSQPDLFAVARSGCRSMDFRFRGRRTERLGTELLAGQRVVHHHDIAGENGVGYDRQPRQRGNQLAAPAGVFSVAGKGPKRSTELPLRRGGIEYRADHKDHAAFSFGLKSHGPLHPNRRAEKEGSLLLRIFCHFFCLVFRAKDRERAGKERLILLWAGGGDDFAGVVETPDVQLFAAGNDRFQQKQILFSLCHTRFHRRYPPLFSLYHAFFLRARFFPNYCNFAGIIGFTALPSFCTIQLQV